MPYRVCWSPNDGAVTVVTETAREALAIVRSHAEDGRDGVEITDLVGGVLTLAELEAAAATR